MGFLSQRPYNELPPRPPRADVETRAVLKACIAARSALGELNLAGDRIPNQGVLINTISMLETPVNSAIGNIVTTTDRQPAAPANAQAVSNSPAQTRGAFRLPQCGARFPAHNLAVG